MHQEYIEPTPDEIAVCAYHVWEKESRPLSRQKQNWVDAERQLVSARNPNAITTRMASTMASSGTRSKTRQPRILVVDDEPPATQMLGRLLRKHGYIAAGLNDPAKAIQMAHRFLPDLVLLDIHMPWKDGYEVAAAFASDKALSCVPIIFITHQASDRNKSTDSIPILVKPFSIEDLFACLERAIHKPV